VFGIGGTEFFIIAVFVLLIFGPDKLPQMGRTIGKWTKEFRRAQESMQAQIKAEMDGLERATNPFSEKEDGAKKKTPAAGENEFEAQARAAQDVDPEWDEEEEEPE
jgi:TatA/E family protein of Tat protein translocase